MRAFVLSCAVAVSLSAPPLPKEDLERIQKQAKASNVNLPPEIREMLTRFDGGAPTDDEAAMETAKLFFGGIASKRVPWVMGSLARSGTIEAQVYGSDEAYQEAWTRILRQGAGISETVNGISLLTVGEMEKKYGKPPARLHLPPMKASDTRIAVGNLSGRAAVAILQRTMPGIWQVVGYTD